MARAVLEIAADTSGIEAAFGRLRTEAQRLEQQMRAVFAGVAQQGTRAFRDSARTQAAEARRGAQASEREAQRAVLAFVRGEEQKRRAARMTVANQERAERQATELAAQEARKRGLTAEQEARVRTTALQRFTREFEREERRQTQIAQQQNRIRERDGRTVAHGVRRGLNIGGDAAMNVARQAHSQIQDARRSRAEADRSLRFAVTGADRSATSQDVEAARNQVRQFAVGAGMSYEDVVQALRQGQEAGSVLERQGGETSAQAMQRALRLVEEGRAFGTDPGGYLTAQGRLRAAGLRGENLTQAMRFSAVAANAGSVEIGQLMRQGLPGATRLMSQRVAALGPGATEQQRQQAMLSAFRESVATQEVTASAGSTSRQVSNALASLQSFMMTPRRQQQALTNIQREIDATAQTPEGNQRREALRALYTGDNAIFERDPTRRDPNAMRLRQNVSPIELASRVAAAMGGDSQRAANIFAGGGTRNPQAFLANQRELMAFLGGERGTAIRQMMGATAYTQEDVNQRQAALRTDELSNITRADEEGRNALTDNTSKLKQLSDRIAEFNARNPLGSAALQTGGGLLGGFLGGAFVNRAGRALAGNSIAARIVQAVSGTSGAAAVEGAGATAGIGATGLALGTAGIVAMGLQARETVTGRRAGGATATAAEQSQAALAMLSPGAAIGRTIGMAIIDAFRSNPITATISPTDAQHAATQTAPAAGRR